jgi:formimidoylglutamate deiminase
MQNALSFRHVLTPDGMVHDVTLEVGPDGRITALRPAVGPFHGELALPGIPDAHSHCFQRLLAGHGEVPSGSDSFWSWREAMYRAAARIDAEALHAIARQCYAEALAGGYTSVAEFHYLHHAPDGARGPELAAAVIEAAREVGIHLVLLPVYYQTGGFGQPARPEQARFVHATVDEFLRLLESVQGRVPLGVAPHSLRAVPPEILPVLVREVRALLGSATPFHIHVAEQVAEVEACRAAHGATPVELLARSVELDAHWNLVHATHASEAELALIAARDATVVICPSTEAYLGDGLCDVETLQRAGGALAIGSDANTRLDAIEELRWLEYGQRLRSRQRARLADGRGLGEPLWTGVVDAGARALGEKVGGLAIGQRADLLSVRTDGALLGHDPARWLDALIIGGSRADIEDVYVAGQRVVSGGVHRDATRIRADFGRAARRLLRGEA